MWQWNKFTLLRFCGSSSNAHPCLANTYRTVAWLNRQVVVHDRLDNRSSSCPPYTVAIIWQNRLELSPGIHGTCVALIILPFSLGSDKSHKGLVNLIFLA